MLTWSFAGLAHTSGCLGDIDVDNRPHAEWLKGGCMRSVAAILLLASPAFAGEPVYSWQSRADDPDRVYLYRDGHQIGGWCYRARHYRPFDGQTWGPPTATAPVRPPEQRVVVSPPPQPLVMTPPCPAPLPLRGPLRVRLGTAIGQAVTDVAMTMIEDAIPRAIADAVARGQYQLGVQFSVTRSAPPSEGPTTPPSPTPPARSPQR
jgi:hypothetical protein